MLLTLEPGDGGPDLFSGFFGSLTSAVVGALVAVVVVVLTNRSQRKSAAEALNEARRSAEVALKQQREMLLEEVHWAQNSARRSALTSAIASFLAGAQEHTDLPGPDFPRAQKISRGMEKFYFEIALLGGEAVSLAKVLQKWPNLLVYLRLKVIQSGTNSDDRAAHEDRILESVQMLSRAMPKWMSGSPEERAAVEAEITAQRSALMRDLSIDADPYLAR